VDASKPHSMKKNKSTIRFTCFPLTEPPPGFVRDVVGVFRAHEPSIATAILKKGLTSDQLLGLLRRDLEQLGFDVETGKGRSQKIKRPVFYGENGTPKLQYEIDAYHPKWRCGLEVEAGRAWMGNAVYRDLIQALVMVQVEHLCLAVPNHYRFKAAGKDASSHDYDNTLAVAIALYGHSRLQLPYGLTVLGY
jgi:hypothetical protein